jgi:hypothetical protein
MNKKSTGIRSSYEVTNVTPDNHIRNVYYFKICDWFWIYLNYGIFG